MRGNPEAWDGVGERRLEGTGAGVWGGGQQNLSKRGLGDLGGPGMEGPGMQEMGFGLPP